MGVSKETAILVISFGTSYEETRKKTIEQIENDLHHAYPEYPLYRAWTSPKIRAKLLKRDGIHILNIDEAMTQMKEDGIKNVIVQPTYVITGFESDAMKQKVMAFEKDFNSVVICDSLMVTEQDKKKSVRLWLRNIILILTKFFCLWDMEQNMSPMNFIQKWTVCSNSPVIPICTWELWKVIFYRKFSG